MADAERERLLHQWRLAVERAKDGRALSGVTSLGGG